MTKEDKIFQDGLEEYPTSTIIIENLFMFLWIAYGTYLCWTLMPLAAWIYLAFGLIMILYLMRILVCRNCYYHGKRCHLGWGKLSAMYCRQGELTHFGCGFSGAIVPMFYGLMALLPLVFGIISIIETFSLVNTCTIAVFLLIVMMSSFTLRKKSCALCKMKKMCPGCAAKG